MTTSIIEKIQDFIGGDRSIRMVADDVQLTNELILLVRTMFADGELKSAELEAFKRLCNRAFGIPEEDVPRVIQYLREVGYETTAADAASMFKNMDIERKRQLLVHMLKIAKADDVLHEQELQLIRRTAWVLGLDAEDISGAQDS